jgi:hypothetical protein
MLLCLRVVTVATDLIDSDDPGEGFIIGSELTRFTADVDALLQLVMCQDPGHKFGCDTASIVPEYGDDVE